MKSEKIIIFSSFFIFWDTFLRGAGPSAFPLKREMKMEAGEGRREKKKNKKRKLTKAVLRRHFSIEKRDEDGGDTFPLKREMKMEETLFH